MKQALQTTEGIEVGHVLRHRDHRSEGNVTEVIDRWTVRLENPDNTRQTVVEKVWNLEHA